RRPLLDGVLAPRGRLVLSQPAEDPRPTALPRLGIALNLEPGTICSALGRRAGTGAGVGPRSAESHALARLRGARGRFRPLPGPWGARGGARLLRRLIGEFERRIGAGRTGRLRD